MKVFNIVAKVLLALVAVAGAVYAIATYGDKLVAWSRNLLARCKCGDSCSCGCGCGEDCTCGCQDGEPCTCGCDCDCDESCDCQDSEPCCCECECAAAVEEAPVVAEEADFEG